jgi:hypothetical protein
MPKDSRLLSGRASRRRCTRLQGAGARLVDIFGAGSHLEAMDREPYTSSYPDLDSQSYLEEWREVQDRAGIA